MKILLTFDTGYAPHAATVMESVIQNCPEKLDFAVIYYDLEDNIRDILTNHFAEKVKSLEFHQVDESVLSNIIKDIKSAEHLAGFNAYLRLFSPTILTNDSHVIYLDCDVIVQGNILNILTDADLSKPICAVTEYDPAYKYRDLSDLKLVERPFLNPLIYEAYWFRTYRDLKMHINAKYFNTGVMIINLKYWREHNIMKDALVFLLENPDKAFSADQDALNHVVNGSFYSLLPKWNYGNAIFSNYSAQELTIASLSPSIIHFAGGVKPWHYIGESKDQKLYRKYRKQTPWQKIEYKNISLILILKKRVFRPTMRFMKNILQCFIGKQNMRFLMLSLLKLNAPANLYWSKKRI